MKNNKISLSIMIAVISVLSYSASAQQDTTIRKSSPVKTQQEMNNQNKTQRNDTMHNNNRKMSADSSYNQMNKNQQQPNSKDTMGLKSNKMQSQMKSDCIMMQNGKMVMTKDGKNTPMSKDVTLQNGTVCMINGTCKMKDGTTMKMKEGDKIDMNGKKLTSK